MTQGEFYYLLMTISAFVLFALAAAYGTVVAPGKPHKAADVAQLPRKTGSGERVLETEKKEAA